MPPPRSSKKLRQQQPQVRKASAKASSNFIPAKDAPAGAPQIHNLPIELQQVILNCFQTAFPIAHNADTLTQVTQEVKRHLFNRDWDAAFGKPAYLEAYALRWSAARAIGYTHVFTHPSRRHILQPLNVEDVSESSSSNFEQSNIQPYLRTYPTVSNDPTASPAVEVVCLGGGAGAEMVALSAAHEQLGTTRKFKVIGVDIADWSEPVAKLSAALAQPPILSAYASEAVKARPEYQPLVGDKSKVSVSLIHQDVLSWPVENLQTTLRNVTLCTMMFTLNELYTASSVPKVTSLLLNITSAMPQRSHLLVVDSPGSYAEVKLNKDNTKQGEPENSSQSSPKYPMRWFLDHTLLKVAKGDWDKVESEESLWFRIDRKDREKLKYPIELEDMRYQLHLYKRI